MLMKIYRYGISFMFGKFQTIRCCAVKALCGLNTDMSTTFLLNFYEIIA